MTSGVTDRYAGGPSARLYNARATNATKVKGRQPRVASPRGTEPYSETEKILANPSPLPPTIVARTRQSLALKNPNAPLAPNGSSN